MRAYCSRTPSFFSRFVRIGRLREPLRAQLAPEGIVHVAERVHVTQRFSGSAPGVHSSLSVNRQIGLVVFTRERLYALPSRSLAFGVSPDYVFHLLGGRVRT